MYTWAHFKCESGISSITASFLWHVDLTIIQGGREGEVVEYRGVQTGGHPAGGEVAIPAITPNNRDVLIPPSQTHGSHVAPHEQGTSGKQPSAVPRPSSTTPQLVSSSPSPALPSNDTSNERATQVSGHYPTIYASTH